MKPKAIQRLLLRYIGTMSLIAVVLYFIHNYIVTVYMEAIPFIPIWKVYAFLLILSFVAISMLSFAHYVSESFTGYAFIGLVLIKMFASLVFLFPMLKSDLENKVLDVFNFFTPFFVFLFLEVWFSVRLLASKKAN